MQFFSSQDETPQDGPTIQELVAKEAVDILDYMGWEGEPSSGMDDDSRYKPVSFTSSALKFGAKSWNLSKILKNDFSMKIFQLQNI